MRQRLPPLNSLKHFEAAARTGSMTKAAAELFVTQVAVTNQVANLEQALKIQLFNREHHHLSLTPEGAALYETVSDFFRSLYALTSDFNKDDAERIQISSCPNFAMQMLVPRIADFRDRHPLIQVDLDTSRQDVDFTRTQAHAAIRSGSGDWPKVNCIPLADIELMAVCAPEFIKQHPGLKKPNDLANLRLFHSASRPNDWHTWLSGSGAQSVDPSASIQFDNGSLALQAATSGLGIAVVAKILAVDGLRSGRLVDPFSQSVRTSDKYYFITPRNTHFSRTLRVYKDWLVTTIAQHQKPGN